MVQTELFITALLYIYILKKAKIKDQKLWKQDKCECRIYFGSSLHLYIETSDGSHC